MGLITVRVYIYHHVILARNYESSIFIAKASKQDVLIFDVILSDLFLASLEMIQCYTKSANYLCFHRCNWAELLMGCLDQYKMEEIINKQPMMIIWQIWTDFPQNHLKTRGGGIWKIFILYIFFPFFFFFFFFFFLHKAGKKIS